MKSVKRLIPGMLLVHVLAAGAHAEMCLSQTGPINSNAFTDTRNDTNPCIATDGAGNWIAAWMTQEDLGGLIGTDNDIATIRSSDNGVTWTAPVALNGNAYSDSLQDHWPKIETDRNGTWVAVWRSDDSLGGLIGTDPDILYARSLDNGSSWSPPLPVALSMYSDPSYRMEYWPDLAVSAGGTFVTAWAESNPSTNVGVGISRSADGGATWSAPIRRGVISSYNDVYPAVETDDAGNWIVAWQSKENLGGVTGTEQDIHYSVSTDDGVTWSPPAALNSNAATDTSGDHWVSIVSDGPGKWAAVWYSGSDVAGNGTDVDILFARSDNGGSDWSAPLPLTPTMHVDSGGDYYPRISLLPSGALITIWNSRHDLTGTYGTDDDVYYSISTDGGAAWSDNELFGLNGATDNLWDGISHLAAGDDGTVIGAWHSGDNPGGAVGWDHDIFYTRRALCPPTPTPTSSPSPQPTAAPTPTPPPVPTEFCVGASHPLGDTPTTDSDYDSNVHFAFDGDGNGVAVWRTGDVQDLGGDGDIAFATSSDNGRNWSSAGWLNHYAITDSRNDGIPVVRTRGDGKWVTVWESVDSVGGLFGTDSDILFSVSANNGFTWSDALPVNHDASYDETGSRPNEDFRPDLEVSDEGTWVAVWSNNHSRGSYWDIQIRVARSVDGETWSAAVPLGLHSQAFSTNATVHTGDQGNWMVVWDSKSGELGAGTGDADIFCSVSSDDGITWSAPRLVNISAAADGNTEDAFPSVQYDRDGAWIVAWYSRLDAAAGVGTDFDILTARSFDLGQTWSYPAALTSSMIGDTGADTYPRLVGDGRSVMYALWQSQNDVSGVNQGEYDIYFSASHDQGANWTPAGLFNDYGGSDTAFDGIVNVAMGAGGVLVGGWHGYGLGSVTGADSDIIYARYGDCDEVNPTPAPTATLTPVPPTPTATPAPTPTPDPQPAVRAVVCDPLGGSCRAGNRVHVRACLEPDGELWPMVASIRFDYRASGGGEGGWTPIPAANHNHPNPDTSYPFFIHWDVSDLEHGDYDVRAVATDTSGVTDPAPAFITFLVAKNCSHHESLSASGEVRSVASASAGASSGNETLPVISEVVMGGGGMIEVISRDPESIPASLFEPAFIGHFVELTLDAEAESAGSGPPAVTLSYPDTDNDGMIDGTGYSEAGVAIYIGDGTRWAPLADSAVDPVLNTVTAIGTGAGIYAVVADGSPAAGGCACPGDANGDGYVDAADFIAVQSAFGAGNGLGGDGDTNCSGGFVDAADLIAVQGNFGRPCP